MSLVKNGQKYYQNIQNPGSVGPAEAQTPPAASSQAWSYLRISSRFLASLCFITFTIHLCFINGHRTGEASIFVSKSLAWNRTSNWFARSFSPQSWGISPGFQADFNRISPGFSPKKMGSGSTVRRTTGVAFAVPSHRSLSLSPFEASPGTRRLDYVMSQLWDG